MVIRVQAAALRWGYQVAGTLGDCTITQSEGQWAVTGTVVQADAFRVTQRPLAFEVRHARQTWRWPVAALQIAGGTFSASLGPKES